MSETDNLSSLISALEKTREALRPYRDAVSITKRAVEALGDSFSLLVKPEIYDAIKNCTPSFPTGMAKALEPLAYTAASIVDTSWMRMDNQWLVSRELLTGIDTASVSGMTGAFAALCRIEQELSRMSGMPDTMLSVASQVASMYEAIKPFLPLEGIFASAQLIDDYCSFAIQQYGRIQKAADQTEIAWRLGVLDAASKYVDRQASWTISIENQLKDEIIAGSDEERQLIDESAVLLIPTHIGYTRRENIHKTPAEGLETSAIVTITEKGKKLIDGIIKINQLQIDNGKERIFGLSETVVIGMMSIGTVVCTCEDQFGKIIDALYFIFYENLEHIKELIGDGDKTKGDTLIRVEDTYQCIFHVKTLRSDLRHDLEHGSLKHRKKKQLSVGDCYRLYCGNRPLKERDFKKLQEKLYDKILALEEKMLTYQISN